jgi:hypothetical protein
MKYLKLGFTQNTEIRFIDPDTRRWMWYLAFYGRGTSLEVLDILSANNKEIYAKCIDGETCVIDANAVVILGWN